MATLLLTSALVPSLSLLLLFKQKCVGTDSTHPAQMALAKDGFPLCRERLSFSPVWLLYLVVVRKYHIKHFPPDCWIQYRTHLQSDFMVVSFTCTALEL